MNAATSPAPARLARRGRWRDRWERWRRPLLNLAVAVFVGLLLASQISRENPRVIKAVIGAGVLYAAWRFPIPVSLSAIIMLFPFPFPTVYGTSTTLFIFLIAAIWLAQLVLRIAPATGRTSLDVPIAMLLGIYVLSFRSVENTEALAQGLISFSAVVACVFLYYLIVNTVRDEATLRRLVGIISITAGLCWIVAAWELMFPGAPLIRGWVLSAPPFDPAYKGVQRVGGPFGDFELFGEYCAMMLPLTIFQLVQARGLRSRTAWGLLTLVNVVALLATVTRGATIAMVVGFIYLLYRLRRNLNIVQLVGILALGIASWAGVEFFLSNFTSSGSVIERILGTKLVGGLPDSRAFWPKIITRIQEHLWIGHGPYYELGEFGRERLHRFFYPHNGYLYLLHTIGILGTLAFVWILFRLWASTGRACANRLGGPDYAKSLLLVWHIMLTMFIIDQTKIEFLRNQSYQFWPWIVFSMSMATARIVQAREAREATEAAGGAGEPRGAGPP